MIKKISLALFYWAVTLALTIPFAILPPQEIAKVLAALVVAGTILACLEKPWRPGYVYHGERVKPILISSLLAVAVIVTVGWSSWQLIFWLNA